MNTAYALGGPPLFVDAVNKRPVDKQINDYIENGTSPGSTARSRRTSNAVRSAQFDLQEGDDLLVEDLDLKEAGLPGG